MRRLDTPELLDEHDAPAEDVERSLRDLQRFNRWCGGTRVYRKMVRRLLGERTRFVVVDLGAGTADLLDALVTPSVSEGPGRTGGAPPTPPGPSLTLGVTKVAVDWNLRHLLYQREKSRARRVVADARRLPFRDNAADAVTSSHFFHHFTPAENEQIIKESLRVARIGVAFTDTERHILPLLFTLMLRWLHLVGRITRYDAPASIRRGYTASEVREIAPNAIVENYVPFRWAMFLRK